MARLDLPPAPAWWEGKFKLLPGMAEFSYWCATLKSRKITGETIRKKTEVDRRNLLEELRRDLCKLENLGREYIAQVNPWDESPGAATRGAWPPGDTLWKEYRTKEISKLEHLLGRQIRLIEGKVSARVIKVERLEQLRAAKATLEGMARKRAESVKRNLPTDHPCPYCGDPLGLIPHADHIYPLDKGGRSTIENMVMVCRDCNTTKRGLTLSQFARKFNLDKSKIEAALVQLGKAF